MAMAAQYDWPLVLSEWAYAYDQPDANGRIKSTPEDFRVVENLAIEPLGEGEHIWLQISKRRQNTDAVAKALARHANVAYRDVGYSGLKDFQAVSQQWFSIYQPKAQTIDWHSFEMEGVSVDQVSRHARKIKRGTHQSNRFVITVRDCSAELDQLLSKVETIKKHGVPNYFGEQRFGRNLSNMNQAYAMLVAGDRVKNRHLRGLLLSAARSWLFNCIVSARIENATWNSLYAAEPANLNASNSVFNAEQTELEQQRLEQMDIHPTAPVWGSYDDSVVNKYAELHQFELSEIKSYTDMTRGLQGANLSYQRRPIRMQVNQLECDYREGVAVLRFELLKGQFATSMLRELFVLQ